MKIQEVRRANLRKWLIGKPLPDQEKSLLSRILSAKLAFGERVARRLEITYDMGYMYLDTPIENMSLNESFPIQAASDANKQKAPVRKAATDLNPKKNKRKFSLERIEFVKDLLDMSDDKLNYIRELVNMSEEDFKFAVKIFNAANALAKEVKKIKSDSE